MPRLVNISDYCFSYSFLHRYVRYLIMRLLNSLKGVCFIGCCLVPLCCILTITAFFSFLSSLGKAINYTKDGRSDGEAKSNLFMMNNAFYILEELGPNSFEGIGQDAEYYRIQGTWFSDKVTKIMDSEKAKYLCAWEQLNTHLTAVASNELEYQKNDRQCCRMRADVSLNRGFLASTMISRSHTVCT